MYLTTEPHAPNTASAAAALPSAAALGEGFAVRVLDEIDYGLILVSVDGTLEHANHLARHEIARGRFLRNVNGRIAGLSAEQTEELQRGVRWAARGRRQMLTLRNGSKTLSVACVPLSEPFEGQQGNVLLMLARQTGTQNLAVTFFAQTHGLTPAEEGVLRALCDGMDVQEVAAHNGVSESTVRTQVRSLREKTQSSSIRQLVQQVAALPPVVPISLALPAQGGSQLAA